MRIEILFVLQLCYHELYKTFKLVSTPMKVSADHELKRIATKSFFNF